MRPREDLLVQVWPELANLTDFSSREATDELLDIVTLSCPSLMVCRLYEAVVTPAAVNRFLDGSAALGRLALHVSSSAQDHWQMRPAGAHHQHLQIQLSRSLRSLHLGNIFVDRDILRPLASPHSPILEVALRDCENIWSIEDADQSGCFGRLTALHVGWSDVEAGHWTETLVNFQSVDQLEWC